MTRDRHTFAFQVFPLFRQEVVKESSVGES